MFIWLVMAVVSGADVGDGSVGGIRPRLVKGDLFVDLAGR